MTGSNAIPLPSHNFIVEIASKSTPFSKVQSIEIGVETEPLVEGGENRFVHSLSKQNSTEKTLILERIVLSDDMDTSLQVGRVYDTMTIIVLDQHRCRKKTYMARFVILKKRSLSSGLNAMAGEVLIETMEFIYREMTEVP